MHANRNKKAIKRVERGMMKANRIRNLFAVFAIVLTTFMITTVFSLGINYMENMKLMQVRTAGTTANASLAMPTAEQEQQIRDLEYVKTVGTQYMVGSVAEKNDEGRELSIALSYYDTTEWDKHYKETIKDIEGKYPSNENEIMLSEDALSQLGMKEPKLNMEIPLSYYDKNGQQEKNFTLSGWFHSYTGTGMGFVSEAYCKNAGYTMAEDGVLSLSLNKMPDDFYRIQKDVELNENQSFGGAVSMKSSSGSVIAMVILLVFFIIGSGYLLIYNVLYISISKDTRFYGLMKTLGTTQKQIKSLVKNQAVKFACIGIPIGILLATAVSFGIVPFVLNEGFEQGKSMMDAEVFFHPSIYILSVIFSAVTVWIACNAPAKAAAKISPIEALKFQNFAPKKTKSRNSTNGGKLHVMAFHNVFRDKKRAVLVFMSLFMGITMILGVNGVISSMSAENFIKEYMDYNFEYTDIQFEQYEQLNKEVTVNGLTTLGKAGDWVLYPLNTIVMDYCNVAYKPCITVIFPYWIKMIYDGQEEINSYFNKAFDVVIEGREKKDILKDGLKAIFKLYRKYNLPINYSEIHEVKENSEALQESLEMLAGMQSIYTELTTEKVMQMINEAIHGI